MQHGDRVFGAEISHGLAQRHHWFASATESALHVEQAVDRAMARLWGQYGPCRLHSVSMMPLVLSSGTQHETTWCLVGVIVEKV
jgi:hypothetical protein